MSKTDRLNTSQADEACLVSASLKAVFYASLLARFQHTTPFVATINYAVQIDTYFSTSITQEPGSEHFNIVGLATGITAFTLLLFYIQKENNYDRHNDHPDQVYRIVNNYRMGNDHNTTAWTAPALVAHVQGQVSGIAEAVRLFRYRSPVVMVDRAADKNFMEPNSVWADANVFRVFTFDFVAGDPAKALVRLNTMVITESMAKKYF